MRTAILTLVSCGALMAASLTTGMTTGRLHLQSAGALAFGPEGILFIGDSLGAAVIAVDTHDTVPVALSGAVRIEAIDNRIAALLGTDRREILIEDVKVNPISKNIYISVLRGRGPDALPVILKADASGTLSEVALDNVPYSSVPLPNVPKSRPEVGSRNPRLETITQMAYVEDGDAGATTVGRVLVAGLSNEEFASNLRSIPFPFTAEARGTSVEIFHGSHGQFETKAPVRTFVPWTINGETNIIAAYTCTPLVTIPLKDLKPGAKVTGRTIAELGAGNRPLDMITYRRDGHDFILMANSYRGVMKLPAENLDSYKPITEAVVIEGVEAERITALHHVRRLAKLDEANALILTDGAGFTSDLRSVPLP